MCCLVYVGTTKHPFPENFGHHEHLDDVLDFSINVSAIAPHGFTKCRGRATWSRYNQSYGFDNNVPEWNAFL